MGIGIQTSERPPFEQAQDLETLKRLCAEAWDRIDERLKALEG